MFTVGHEFINESPGVVIDFLNSRKIEKISASPSALDIFYDNNLLHLNVRNGSEKTFPIRKTFLYKLLRWHNFQLALLHKLSPQTIVSLCNDFLKGIKRPEVTLKIEDNEALTILSADYNELSDLEVIAESQKLSFRNISRNDFFLSIQTHDMISTQPVPGDIVGIGINILNSETGFRALSVMHHLLRYICTNGAVAPVLSSTAIRYHYGPSNLKSFLHQQISQADKTRHTFIDKLLHLTQSPIHKPKAHYVSLLEPLLGRKDSENFFQKFDELTNMYDLFNLITFQAQKFDLSRRHYIESVAGKLL